MSDIATLPNPDLTVVGGNKSHWTHADHRREGFHNLHKIARYTMSFRSARVMLLEKRMELGIADFEPVRHLTALPAFSAMVVIRGPHVLFERYAPDFGDKVPHSCQSITKTTMNLVIGKLVDERVLDLSRSVAHYLPQIGSGYASATLQEVLNMDVVNEYSEDFTDPSATYYSHEEAMGWRLPADSSHEETQRTFLERINSHDTRNRIGHTHYKDANTDILGCIAEMATGRPLRAFLADIVDAAGLEESFHITTDREGFPALDGGACLTARDLTRYFSLFVRGGLGVYGEKVGSADFIDRTLSSGVQMQPPYAHITYSNHIMVSGPRSIGHGGWGGQYVMANLDTGTIGAFFSVIENQHGTNGAYLKPVIEMLELVTGRAPESAS